jgi:arylsulfatase A-like enzyme
LACAVLACGTADEPVALSLNTLQNIAGGVRPALSRAAGTPRGSSGKTANVRTRARLDLRWPLASSAAMLCPRSCTRAALASLLAVAAFIPAGSSRLDPQQAPAAAARRPNVILVLTDDQGYGDLSCHGNPVLKTPHLDALAAESVRLEDYHVSPTCSPTRAALQTGRWSNRTGAWHTINGRSLLRRDEVTLGQVFAAAGYATGMFGKWHLGDNAPCRPEDRGYREVLRCGGGGVGQTPDSWDNAYFDGRYWHNGTPEPVEGFCTDVFFAAATAFVRRCKQAGEPFFVYLAPNAAHGPMHAPLEAAAPYANARQTGKPQPAVALANFFGMIANIDDNVGRMRALLAEEGLAENTIFVFTTDNGTAMGQSVCDGGMRGIKGSEYDGGHRVPCFVSWPAGGIGGSRRIERITAHVDVLPTLCALCDVPLPQDRKLDGISLAPWLRGGDTATMPDRILVTDSQRVIQPRKWKQSAVMTDRWRLVNGRELHDLDADPKQQHDVAAEHAEVVGRLRAFYEAWWRELEPTFADDVRLALGDPREPVATLTAHDWITEDSTPWHQGHIRQGLDDPSVTGFWNVHVARAGRYEFALRRWPRECGAPIRAAVAPGATVPGVAALRTRPGVALDIESAWLEIAGRREAKPVGATDAAVHFELSLAEGDTTLTAHFVRAAGREVGAYYVDVRRLGDN